MSTPAEPTPAAIKKPARCRFRSAGAVLAIALGAIITDGARRTPADATKPVPWVGSSSPNVTTTPRLRIATFNIHSGRGRDRKMDLARTASVLDPESPDIVGLNEVRGTFDESMWPDQAAELGKRLGMKSAFLPTERRWWHDHFGNALLTRIPIRQVHRIPLVGTRGKAYRSATLAQFEFQNKTVQLVSVHIDSQSDREVELRAVISLFLGLQSPALLIGDLNSIPEDSQLQELLTHPDVIDALRDVKGHRIDWILVRGFKCTTSRQIETDASDHPAAIAELELID